MRRVGIVVALAAEGRSLTSRPLPRGDCLDLKDGTLLIVADAGREAAFSAAARLADAGATALISWGCAAALDPRLKPGDLVLPRSVLEKGGKTLPVAADWHKRVFSRLDGHLSLSDGAVTESLTIVSTAAEKAALFAATGAVALDMESAAVASVAGQRGLPAVVVRSIVDPAGLAVPPSVQAAFDAGGKLHLRKLLIGLMQHPGDVPGLIQLGWHFRAAMQTLRKVKALAGQSLGNPD